MDELREEIANLEGEMERLSAACRVPGAPPSYELRIGLIADGLAAKRALLGDLTRRVRGIEADITAHPSGVYPAITQPPDTSVIPPPQGLSPPTSVIPLTASEGHRESPNALQLPTSAPVDATPPPLDAHIAEVSVADSGFPLAAAVTAEPVEPGPSGTIPTAQSQTEPSAPILPEEVAPTPESEILTGTPGSGGDSSSARLPLTWVFIAAVLLVLGLLIAGLLADVRRAPPPQPSSFGAGPGLFDRESSVKPVLESTY
jgi:hypothetical protein